MVGSQPSIVRSKSDFMAAKCFKIGNITNKLANSFLCIHLFALVAMFCNKHNYHQREFIIFVRVQYQEEKQFKACVSYEHEIPI